MNRQTFISKFKMLYGDYTEGMLEAYYTILKDPSGTEINYDKLYNLLITKYKYRTAPMPAWFAEKLPEVTIRKIPASASRIERELARGEAQIIFKNPVEGWCDIKTKIGVYRFHDPEVNNAYLKRQEEENG